MLIGYGRGAESNIVRKMAAVRSQKRACRPQTGPNADSYLVRKSLDQEIFQAPETYDEPEQASYDSRAKRHR